MDDLDPPNGSTTLGYMVNHVFLPLGLPSRPDKESCDSHLLGLFLSSTEDFVSLCNNSERSRVNQLVTALQILQSIRKEDGSLHSDKLRTASQQVIGQGKCRNAFPSRLKHRSHQTCRDIVSSCLCSSSKCWDPATWTRRERDFRSLGAYSGQ